MRTLLFAACLLALTSSGIAADERDTTVKPRTRETRQIEGWTVHIDTRLLSEPNQELGARAIRLLSNRLYEIAFLVPSNRVARLQEVPIWLDLDYGKLQRMQYHPNIHWLEDHGYDTNLAKSVHLPQAAFFASRQHHRVQPWSVLHELAHSYHDRVLGFDYPPIKNAWEKWRQKKEYENTLYINGSRKRHYGLTDHKEFFAEMTEAYFGVNDFYPFNRGELKEHEPEIYHLMEEIWGK